MDDLFSRISRRRALQFHRQCDPGAVVAIFADLHPRGSNQNRDLRGIKFQKSSPICIWRLSTSISVKLGLEDSVIKMIECRLPMSESWSIYRSFVLVCCRRLHLAETGVPGLWIA